MKKFPREIVKQYSELPDSEEGFELLPKQILAHQIKANPKLYGIYINDFLAEGWKSINLENWRYERRKEIAKASPIFKECYQLVRNYFAAAYVSHDAWQAAIKRRNVASPNYQKFVQRAQGLSYQRDKIASQLVNNMERHAGALGFEKVDLAKLTQRARHYDYFARYLIEENQTRKLHMAHHIGENLRDYGHAVAVHGVYQELKERAHYYDYLHLVKAAPDQTMRDLIRLAENYYQKHIEVGRAWGQVKALEKVGKGNLQATQEGKHVLYQRNKAAHDFIENCAKNGLLDPEIKGIKLNYEQLHRASQQHIAYQRVLNYLNAKELNQGFWANELLKDRSSYHFIFDKKIVFDDLRVQANSWLNSQALAVEPVITKQFQIKRWDIEAINQALMANPEDTYTSILGEPKKRSGKEWRYADGLIVTLKGTNAGKWYSFTENKGGSPVTAIQEYLGLSFKDALAHGAKLAGLSDAQANITETIEIIQGKAKEKTEIHAKQEAIEREHRIESAQSIWGSTQSIKDTLAERYFIEHRKINNLKNMDIRYWEKGSPWIDTDEKGKRIEKINKIPAAVVAVKNCKGDITGVQRIYLDEKTAGKNTFMDNAKLSKGITQGSAGVIQIGIPGGRLYVVEGPETGASIASVDKDATILASLSVSNLANLGDVIHSYSPNEIIIAADNDGEYSATRKTTLAAFEKLKDSLENEITKVCLVFPQAIPGLEKVDWNDVLVKQGSDVLKNQLGITQQAQNSALDNETQRVIAQFDELEKVMQNAKKSGYAIHERLAMEDINKYALEVSQNAQMMQKLHEVAPKLEKQITEIVTQEYEIEL